MNPIETVMRRRFENDGCLHMGKNGFEKKCRCVPFAVRALVLTFSFMCLTPGTPVAEESGADGTVVILVATGPPRTLNSAVATGYSTGMISAQLFASPLRYDDNWQPKPYLAEQWRMSEDGLTLTLNLVKGATFHDGHFDGH